MNIKNIIYPCKVRIYFYNKKMYEDIFENKDKLSQALIYLGGREDKKIKKIKIVRKRK